MKHGGSFAGPGVGFLQMNAAVVRTSMEVLTPNGDPVFVEDGVCEREFAVLTAGECVRRFRHSTAIFRDNGIDGVLQAGFPTPCTTSTSR